MKFGKVALFYALLPSNIDVAWSLMEEPFKGSKVGRSQFKHADLDIQKRNVRPKNKEIPKKASQRAQAVLKALGAPLDSGSLDTRSGRFAAMFPVKPLIPGDGAGNILKWDEATGEPADNADLGQRAKDALVSLLQEQGELLEVDINEFLTDIKVTVHGKNTIQVYMPRTINGIPVLDSYISATISHGNLILLGYEKVGDINMSLQATVTKAEAMAKLNTYTLGGRRLKGKKIDEPEWNKGQLAIVPMANGRKADQVPFGKGYKYRLVWVLHPTYTGEIGLYKSYVDAKTGEVLSFEDTIDYLEAKGGVYPVTNDGIVPDGVEQAGWPMPFLDTSAGTTDTGGNVPGSGSVNDLRGPYVDMNDNCGTASLPQSSTLDFGTSSGTDCTTPGFGGQGNTHSSRSGFYELNKIIEMGRGQLPNNSWLTQRLTSNMNINNSCNAYWNGTVNFYRSGGGCANTGEIAGVFDHEWGHGMDANDANPGISSPSGEGIADIYTALRLNDSCIGRNFLSGNCSGNGDPCLSCSGVRDIDYLKRQSGNPHTYTWSNSVCGGSVHCIGAVYSEAVWSLWKRKLQQAPYNYDNNSAHEIVTRLTFQGAGMVGTWFSGGAPNGGCAATSGYMNYLAADDDNGNLNDGTPHMQAIYDAFNDQEIACQTPAVQDSGCVGTPTVAPSVTASPGNKQINLSWGSVAGTTEYEIFRTEGVFGCDFGKVKIGATTGTSLIDTGLQNGRDYSYIVIPKGSSDSCFGRASSCVTETPIGAPDFSVSCSPSSSDIWQGASSTLTCAVTSDFGYTGNVNLSCSGNPPGIGCAFTPNQVSPPANGDISASMDLNVDLAQATGTFNIDVIANDGGATRTSSVSVRVLPFGSNGPQTAVFDAGMGAPQCSIAGSECNSGALLDGRGNIAPGEPNQPNTMDSCTDGTSGSYHSDESNDRIVVRTLDGSNMAEGDTVEVEAIVWAWSTGSADTADFYYAADANNPVWTHLGSVVPPGGGEQTLTLQHTLPTGSLQAVRVNFRYQGSQSSCSGGSYDEADDLVFAVEGPVSAPTTNAPSSSPSTYPTGAPITSAPSSSPSAAPTGAPVTDTPTGAPSANPSKAPSETPSTFPTTAPVTDEPTGAPATGAPVTNSPTGAPATDSPTGAPVTDSPTGAPTTDSPTGAPVTDVPTGTPVTDMPTSAPATVAPVTDGPTGAPVTGVPTGAPVTTAPVTDEPTGTPVSAPTSSAPTVSCETLCCFPIEEGGTGGWANEYMLGICAGGGSNPDGCYYETGSSGSAFCTGDGATYWDCMVTNCGIDSPTHAPTTAPVTDEPTGAPATANPTISPSPAPTTSAYYLACGASHRPCSGQIQAAAITEKHEVRCCSDVALPNWNKRSSCDVWGESIFPDGPRDGCYDGETYASAESICASNGGRLCTKEELLADCTRGSGCSHDSDMIWSSSPVVPTVSPTDAPTETPSTASPTVTSSPTRIGALGETGRVLVSHLGVSVDTRYVYADPVVVAFINTRNGDESVDVRVKDVTSRSFKLFLEEPPFLNNVHGDEQVSYVVMEKGTHELDGGLVVQAGVHTTDTVHRGGQQFLGDPIIFDLPFTATPAVLATLNTYNNGQFMSSLTTNVQTTNFEIGQEALETDVLVAPESIGWMAFEQGANTTSGGSPYHYIAGYAPSDGLNDGIGQTGYTIDLLSAAFAVLPDLVVNLYGENGSDGSYARGAGTFTNAAQSVYAEEDVKKDGERNHASEPFAWVGFGHDTNLFGTTIV